MERDVRNFLPLTEYVRDTTVFRPLRQSVTHKHPTKATSTELTLNTITPRPIFPINLK